jgi:hypothetical protein
MKRAIAAIAVSLTSAAAAAGSLDRKSEALAADWGRSLARMTRCGADADLVNAAALWALADYLPALERVAQAQRLSQLTAYRDAVKRAYDTSELPQMTPEQCRDHLRAITRRIEEGSRRAEEMARRATAPAEPKR